MSTEELYLTLPGSGRTLAYAHDGNLDSADVVIFLHGVFGKGEVSRMSPALVERGVHFIAPTLPGWGKTSPVPSTQPYHTCLYNDITALITHLYPTQTDHLRLYLSGGSFGTVAAQILYGASYDAFPLGRQVVGLLLMGPFSHPRYHKGFNSCLNTMNYISLGTPFKLVPFNLIQRLGVSILRSKVDTPEHAEAFIRDFAFAKLDPEERAAFEKWKETRGLAEGQAEKGIGRSISLSVATSWEGFLAVPKVVNSDWGGYDPRHVDENRKVPVLVVMNHGDKDHKLMGEWLVKNMKDATARYDVGGHMAAMFFADSIWKQFLDMTMSGT